MHVQRMNRLRSEMKTTGTNWLALVPGPNLKYLTGEDFHFMERALIVFISADENVDPVVVLPKFEVGKWERGVPLPGQLFPWEDHEGPDEAMRLAAKRLGDVATLFVEHLRMRVLEQSLLQRYMLNVRLERAEDVLSALRMRKDVDEVTSMRRAVEVTEEALAATTSEISPGMTEREIRDRLLVAMMSRGGESIPFEPLVQSGLNSAMPHGQTSDRAVQRGDMLLIDIATTVNGYHSDITRTFFIGDKVEENFGQIYGTVKRANEAGRAAIRPGVTCQEVDRAVRQVIVDAGYGRYFTHRTGHGLGLEEHEEPSVVEGNSLQLEPGMTLTVEPGIYIEGWGGVRIEDDVVVTEEGCDSISTFERGLQLIGV